MEMGIATIVMMVVMCGGMLLFGHKAHKGHKESGKAVGQEAALPKSTGTAAGLPMEGMDDIYECSMKDYRGPKTADGRCPKCGMALEQAR